MNTTFPSTIEGCVLCGAPVGTGQIILACDHYWCIYCLIETFESVKTAFDWPIMCCASYNLPTRLAEDLLNNASFERLRLSIEEAETPPSSRIHCTNNVCSRFLSQVNTTSGIVHCPACKTENCIRCAQEARTDRHPNMTVEDEAFFTLARQNQWQRCENCGRMCERESGCHRMICFCGYSFCYNCGRHESVCRGFCRNQDTGDNPDVPPPSYTPSTTAAYRFATGSLAGPSPPSARTEQNGIRQCMRDLGRSVRARLVQITPFQQLRRLARLQFLQWTCR